MDKDVEKWQESDSLYEQHFLAGEEGLIER